MTVVDLRSGQVKHLPGQHNQLDHGRRFRLPSTYGRYYGRETLPYSWDKLADVAARWNGDRSVKMPRGREVDLLKRAVAQWTGGGGASGNLIGLTSYEEAGWDNVMRKGLDGTLDERDVNVAGGLEAAVLLSAIDAAPANAPRLHRGLRVYDADVLAKLTTEGATIDLPVSSFSSAIGVAESFSGAPFDNKGDSEAVMLTLEPDARALNIESQAGSYKGQREWLTLGRFVVEEHWTTEEPTYDFATNQRTGEPRRIHHVRIRQVRDE